LSDEAERTVVICNKRGLHARAAARFVHLAGRFSARIQVSRDGWTVDGKSILGLLLLAAAAGTRITLAADGPDEQAAADALGALVAGGFGETA